MRPVKVADLVLLHKIIRFAIPGEMNDVSQVLQVKAEMETTRCMSEPLSADNKKDFHGSSGSIIL
jgi:hypothetical protein